MKEKPTWKIIKTLNEDYCIIEENTPEHTAVKLASFDELESGNVVWDVPLIEAQLRAFDKAQEKEKQQKIA